MTLPLPLRSNTRGMVRMSNINLTLRRSRSLLNLLGLRTADCGLWVVQFKNTQRNVTSTYAIYVTSLRVRQVQITVREREEKTKTKLPTI